MTLHRPRRPYSLAYARRKLASIDAQLATWRATDCAGDWRRACDKRRALDRLESEWMRWDRIVHPRVLPEWRMPF